MIYGIGTDIAKVSRFEKWVEDSELYMRFFHKNEFPSSSMSISKKCEHLASRFAAKEAFSKALGTGVRGFSLDEICVVKDELEKPSLVLCGKAREIFEQRCGVEAEIHLSLSHEKEYALAFVVIDN